MLRKAISAVISGRNWDKTISLVLLLNAITVAKIVLIAKRIITYLINLSRSLYLPKNKTTEQITIMIIVHISVLKTPLVRDAANPAVTIVTAVCIVNIVARVIIAYAINMPLPNL